MKAKRTVMAVAVLVLVIAMACALVSCDLFGGGGSDNKDTTYEVTVQCDTSLGSVSGGGKFKQGDSVTIIATANEGYSFIGWYDGETKVSDQAEWTFSMGEKAISYTAKFSVNSYTVNLDCDLLKGSVTGGGNYEYGSSVTITATAKTGYAFIGWYDGENVISTDAEYTFIMGDNNIAWTAKFSINKYVINLDCETEQGTVTGGGEFTYGSSLTIIAEEKAGYKFIGWFDGENFISDETNYTFTCINNANYNAKFEKLNLVQISCDLEQGSVTGGGEYNNGESVTITATAKTGYSFVGWYDGSTLVSTDVRYTFVMGSNGVNYTAKFKANQYSLTLECNSEQGTVTGSGEYDYGSSVTITATENIGYIFDAWYDGAKKISEQANYTFNMVAKNVTYTAKYTTDTIYEKLELLLLDDGTYKITGVKDSSIRNIKIPNYVSIIGDYAFFGCTSLTSLIIGNGVTSIGSSAFFACSALTNVTIPDSVTSIGSSAFFACSALTNVTIPDSVTSIGYRAFEGCSSLTSVTMPVSVTSIGDKAFEDCSNISEVKYNGTIDQWLAISGLDNLMSYSYFKKLYIGESELTDLVIPNSVTSIRNYAFYGCSGLTSVTIPDSVTSIGNAAFYNSNVIAEVYNLSSLNITKGSEDNGYVAYRALDVYTSLSDFSKLTKKEGMILHTDSNNVTLVRYIGDSTCVTIPNSVTSIGDFAFSGCSSLTSVTIPNSVTSIGKAAFWCCSSLTSVTIPNSVTSIGWDAFRNCSSLTSVTIGNSVTSIGSSAFYNCSSLTSVTIPNSVTSIGDSAFWHCSSLSEVKYNGTIEQWCAISVLGVMYYDSNKKLYIGDKEITGDLVIPDSVTSIGDYAFYNCSGLTSVIIPDSVIGIGRYAFYGCSSLTSITLPFVGTKLSGTSNTHFGYIFGANKYEDNVKYVPKSLKEVIIVGGESISDSAFYKCSSLTSVTIPNSVTSIGFCAFIDCSSLTSVTIGKSVTSIGDFAFSGCSSLTSVTIPNSVTSIGLYAFSGCSSLTSVTIGKSVISIGDDAFAGCSSLTSVTIPNSVTSIGLYAFSGCSSLTSVTFKNTTGWFVSQSSNATSGTDITVTDPSQNAVYLKDTYRNYYWKRG